VIAKPRVLVVGSGLIGASIGLGLRRRGIEVWLEDRDPACLRLAHSRGAGQVGPPPVDPDVVFVAVPPAETATVIEHCLRKYVNATVSDVASTKAHLQVEIEGRGVDLARFVPGHPLAGREVSGAGAATADLFADRVWALAPSAATDPDRTAAIEALVSNLGALVVRTTPAAHDRAVALTSHTPQVVSSIVAAGLASLGESEVRLSGQGLRDVTRLASSDPDLWTDILISNAEPVAEALDGLVERLGVIRDGLRRGRPDVVRAALDDGNSGAGLVPGKHGSGPLPYVVVRVVIEDRPGELGRLFAAVGDSGVNLEDVRIDHAQGRPTGVVELEVRPESAGSLAAGLRAAQYEVRD
jgi:prephenate dehydrogenase